VWEEERPDLAPGNKEKAVETSKEKRGRLSRMRDLARGTGEEVTLEGTRVAFEGIQTWAGERRGRGDDSRKRIRGWANSTPQAVRISVRLTCLFCLCISPSVGLSK